MIKMGMMHRRVHGRMERSKDGTGGKDGSMEARINKWDEIQDEKNDRGMDGWMDEW